MDDASRALQIVPPHEVPKMLQDGKALIETILNQPKAEMKPIVDAIQLKTNVAKSFTEFLLYVIKLFQEAIEKKTITLSISVKQSIMSELQFNYVVLINVRNDFCRPGSDTPIDGSETPVNDSIAVVVECATKMTNVIKSLQKKHWLRWFRSAKNISALVPIFEKITEVVRGVQCIERKTLNELFGDVAALQDSLVDIEKRLLVTQGVGLSASILVGIGSIICMIVGGILLATPAGVPLLAVGGAGVGVSIATVGGTALCSYLATKRLDRAKTKGDTRGDKFIENDTTELPQFS